MGAGGLPANRVALNAPAVRRVSASNIPRQLKLRLCTEKPPLSDDLPSKIILYHNHSFDARRGKQETFLSLTRGISHQARKLRQVVGIYVRDRPEDHASLRPMKQIVALSRRHNFRSRGCV